MDIRKNEKIRLNKENEELQMCITNIENEISKLKNISASDFTRHQIAKEESNLAKKQELLDQEQWEEELQCALQMLASQFISLTKMRITLKEVFQ